MRDRIPVHLAIVTAAILGVLSLDWWLGEDPAHYFQERLPGMDNAPRTTVTRDAIEIGEYFSSFDGVHVEIPGAWPQFRGADLDHIDKDPVRLADSWPATGPKILWSVELGEGYAAPAVLNGRVYLLDYDEKEKADALRCFSLADGKEIWRRWYRVSVKRNHGMSRTMPAVSEKYAVTIGPLCHVMCVDSVTGDFRWGIDLVREYGTKVPLWYAGQCPILDQDLAVIAPAGSDTLLMGVECATGKIVWKTPNARGWNMSHSSVTPMTFHGKKMYVYSALGGLVGVSAAGEDRGAILWEVAEWDHQVVVPSPVVLENGCIFVTAGYGSGSMIVKVESANGKFSATPLKTFKSGICSEQQTPIFYEGHLFAVLPKDAGPLKSQFACCRAADCEKIIWSSGESRRFGLGPYVVADGKFFVLDDEGTLTMLRAGVHEYVELGQARVLQGHDSWGPMSVVGGRMLVRDFNRMVCLDLR